VLFRPGWPTPKYLSILVHTSSGSFALPLFGIGDCAC